MEDITRIDIMHFIEQLVALVEKSCWNKLNNSYSFILSKIINIGGDFNEKREKRNELNKLKKPLDIRQASLKLEKLYPDLYDVSFFVYKATKKDTTIEIQYFLKSSLDKEYFEKIKNNEPILNCKVSIPFYLTNKNDKFDVNWELGGLRHKWKIFWHSKVVRH